MENSTDGVPLTYEKKSTGPVRAFKSYLWGQHFGNPEAGDNQSDLHYVSSCCTRCKCLHISWEFGTELRFRRRYESICIVYNKMIHIANLIDCPQLWGSQSVDPIGNFWKNVLGPYFFFHKLPMGSTLWEPRSWGQSIRFAICIILLYTMRMLSYLLGIWNRITISQNMFFLWYYYSLPQKKVHNLFFFRSPLKPSNQEFSMWKILYM